MSRTRTLLPDDVRRVRRDTRFRAALANRYPAPRWREQALCLRENPELFFPGTSDDPEPALEVCSRCPVSAPCLAAALDAGDADGVWGATTQDERWAMRQVWSGTAGTQSRGRG